jgi:hypothetical protein
MEKNGRRNYKSICGGISRFSPSTGGQIFILNRYRFVFYAIVETDRFSAFCMRFFYTSLSYILKSRTTEINVIIHFVNSRRFFRVVDDQIVFFTLIF